MNPLGLLFKSLGLLPFGPGRVVAAGFEHFDLCDGADRERDSESFQPNAVIGSLLLQLGELVMSETHADAVPARVLAESQQALQISQAEVESPALAGKSPTVQNQ